MTRRVPEGARRERNDKRETTRKAKENFFSRSSDFFGMKTVVLTDQARVRVCLRFPTFLFLKSAAYAVHRVKVDSKLTD